MPDRATIVKELIEYNKRPRIDDEEFLLSDYRDQWEEAYEERLPEQTAREHLKRMEQDGLISTREVFVNGYYYVAYKKVEGE